MSRFRFDSRITGEKTGSFLTAITLTTLFSRLILSCFSFVLFVENCLVMTRDNTMNVRHAAIA